MQHGVLQSSGVWTANPSSRSLGKLVIHSSLLEGDSALTKQIKK